jgi:hypothetical protein
VCAGSWRPEKQLELWDYGTGKPMESIPWDYTAASSSQACMLYAAQFSKVSSQTHGGPAAVGLSILFKDNCRENAWPSVVTHWELSVCP